VPDALPDALPDGLEPGFHCVGTHWIPGFIAFQRARRTRTMRLMVPVEPESGFRERAIRPWSMSKSSIAFYVHKRGIRIE
jgi:hypothetical protein